MQILKFPASELYERCSEVDEFNPSLNAVLNEMYTTMIDNSGMGLAANQVGIRKRMFVMRNHEGKAYKIINPIIVQRATSEKCDVYESCLSASLHDKVNNSRPYWVTVNYQDETGKYHTTTFISIDSVCVQHEIEHLDGVVFMDKFRFNTVRM